MNPKQPINKKPTHTLTWKKHDQYAKIETTLHQTSYINKDTGKTEYTLQELSEIPPIKRKHKTKHK